MDYLALKTEIALPAYNGMTDAQILAALNAKTVSATTKKALINTNDIINAIQSADFPSTQIPLLQMQLLIGGRDVVDASPGTTIRAVFQSIFAGKTQTLNALAALVAPYDSPTQPWAPVALGCPSGTTLTQPDLDKARAS